MNPANGSDVADMFEERAGIYQYEAGNTRQRAEYLAMIDVRNACEDRVLINRIYMSRKTA